MICALVLAGNHDRSLLCFWDEPESYLALNEVGHLVATLRQSFQNKGQFIATSQSLEAILRFSEENTLVLQRNTHLDPAEVRSLRDLNVKGDLSAAILQGDLRK